MDKTTYTWTTFDTTKMDNIIIITKLLNENYIEDKNNRYRAHYAPEFIYWYLNSAISLNVVIMDSSKLIGFICGRKITMHLKNYDEECGEINFLCIDKTIRNKKLCPMLINEITKQFQKINVYEAIYTGHHMYPNILTSINYYIRPINIKYLIDIGYLTASVNMGDDLTELEHAYILPKLKTGNKTLIKLTHEHIAQCHILYCKYMNNFDCYEIMSKEQLTKMLINDNIISYVLIVGNVVLDFISYYIIKTLVLKHNKMMTDGYNYLYTNTSNHLHKMVLMLLHTLRENNIDTYNIPDIMNAEDDIYEELQFTKEGNSDSPNFHYFLFKNNNLKINNKKLAKIIF